MILDIILRAILLPLGDYTRNIDLLIYLTPLAELLGVALSCFLPFALFRALYPGGPIQDARLGSFPLKAVACCFFTAFLFIQSISLFLWAFCLHVYPGAFKVFFSIRFMAFMVWTSPAEFFLAVFLVARRYPAAWKEIGAKPLGHVRQAVFLTLGLFALRLGLGLLVHHGMGGGPGPRGLSDDMLELLPPGWLFYVFLIFVLATPVAEELFFRGLVFAAYEQAMAPWAALFAQGLAFALVHNVHSLLSFLLYFIAGLFLGIIRKRTDSLLPCMAYHIAWNALWFGLAVLRLR